jgi:molybdopterin synthase catalytic subunit
MAEKKIVELCQTMRSKWTLHNVAIWHRLGIVKPMEASVVIAVTSEHRQESLEAVQVMTILHVQFQQNKYDLRYH